VTWDELLRLAGERVDGPTPAVRARARLRLNAEISRAPRRPGATWMQRAIAVAAASVAFGLVITQPSAPPDTGNAGHVPQHSIDKLELINGRITEVRARLRSAEGEARGLLRERLAHLRSVRLEICGAFAPPRVPSGCPPR
jgi:hypothetical protein